MTPAGAPATRQPARPAPHPPRRTTGEQPTVQPLAVTRAVEDLATIREQWAELLLAIETPPAAAWPPRQLSHTMRAADEQLVVEERAPLTLREHPAPLNLDALDAGLAIERTLFDLADTLAAAVQHAELDDPRRWNYRSPTSPGSRAHGLHWAAVWVEGRLLAEDTAPEQLLDGTLVSAPFGELPGHLVHEAARAVRGCARRLLRVLELDARETPLGRPCPWCAGDLVLHTEAGHEPYVTCSTGPACGAPVPLDDEERHRVWGWHDLLDLVTALQEAGEQRAAA
ncbi:MULTISPECIES: hypothetical protein [unclassified Streptomyces]|uniref:hypothetical protein n=1 Tax=unclassified Streptomyces TaxID=2593676 RepID=UPI0037F79A01